MNVTARGERRHFSRHTVLKGLLATSSIASVIGAASIAQADTTTAATDTSASDTTVPMITVIARRTEENVQKVPIAVTAIQATALQNEDIFDPVEIQFHSPSIQMGVSEGAARGGFVIRGISGVTTYFAEVPGGPTFPEAPLYDTSSVQVLNGPQGTLFGRTNIAGAVLIQPTKPDLNHFGGSLDVTEGGNALNRATAVLNVPVIPDQLAIRIDLNRNFMNGYTHELGTGFSYNSTNNYGGRISLLWKPGDGKFSEYAMFDYLGADQTPPGFVLSATNPGLSVLQLPTFVSLGFLTPSALFSGVCTAAVADHTASSVGTCVTQRYAALAALPVALQAEMNRINTGGANALNYTAGGDAAAPLKAGYNDLTFVSQTEYDFGNLGFTTLGVRNILSVQAENGQQGFQSDGLGGTLIGAEQAIINGPAAGGDTVCAQQQTHLDAPATASFCSGPLAYSVTEEVQLHGVVVNDLLTWQVGGYYEDDPIPKVLNSAVAIIRPYSGLFDPDYGWTTASDAIDGGDSTEKAIYGQGTLNLSRFVPFMAGLHLTGGVRDTWDYTTVNFRKLVENVMTGAFSAGAADPPTPPSSSSGLDTTVALDAQITNKWLVYGTTRQAYVPGGINATLGASNLPNYAPTYAPELVKDYEVGTKLDFDIGEAHARADVALYLLNFTNIQETFVANIPTTPPSTSTYVGNAAAARNEGVEFQGELIYHNWDFTGVYSYADAKFTKWFGSDPLGIETTPGSSYCVTPPSTSASCVLDLKATPYPGLPKNQVSLTATYTWPLPQDRGKVLFTATGFYQSNEYLNLNTLRDVQVYGPATLKGITQGGYDKFNLRVDWQNIYGSRVSLAAFVDNLTDTHYAVEGIDLLNSFGTAIKLYGEPRTWGLQVRYEFGG